ncbi:hypothetical protein H9P43_003161 [Blastocladiella emersonii ATCC 22665]|nr:hypothetical protein H9P43_003161 [Blastocladiella emersonii ATCC 22665]
MSSAQPHPVLATVATIAAPATYRLTTAGDFVAWTAAVPDPAVFPIRTVGRLTAIDLTATSATLTVDDHQRPGVAAAVLELDLAQILDLAASLAAGTQVDVAGTLEVRAAPSKFALQATLLRPAENLDAALWMLSAEKLRALVATAAPPPTTTGGS